MGKFLVWTSRPRDAYAQNSIADSFSLFVPFAAGKKCTTSPKVKAIPKKKSSSPKPNAPTTSQGGLKPSEDRILQAMGKLRAIDIVQPKRDYVQSFSGNSKTPAGFTNLSGSSVRKVS